MCDYNEKFMTEAFTLALKGLGAVEPNPMVGAVIVRDGQIIARGYHRKFGQLHAERQALKNAADQNVDVRGAEMYVTLEPCCHYGKTPPCTEAIIEAGISKVFVAMTDPDEKVAGKGIEILKQAGVEVQSGILEKQAKRMLAAYCKLRLQNRPWVICKWAQTADGYLALPEGSDRWITNDKSRQHVHWVRSWCDGILVGINTVLADDPMLNNRTDSGKQPLRIVLDCDLKTPPDCNLVKTADQFPLLIVTAKDAPKDTAYKHCEFLKLPAVNGKIDIPALLDELGKRQLTYLLVEGGAEVHKNLIASNLADELYVYQAPFNVAGETKNLPKLNVADIKQAHKLQAEQKLKFDNDTFESFLVQV